MRSIVSRLARLERLEAHASGAKRIVIQYGNLKTLPDDYTGPRHVVTVRQIPLDELSPANRGESWFEWEERSGPEPAPNATGPSDEILVHVCYVDTKMKA